MSDRVRTEPPAPVSPLQWCALGGLLIAALLPASAGVELFPYWDLDPTIRWVPPTGIEPSLMLGLVVLTLLSTGLAMVAESRRGGVVSRVEVTLAAIGSLGVVAHTIFDGGLHDGAIDGIEHAVRAGPWLALVWGAVGVSHLCRDRRVRAVALAVLAGFAVPLLTKGALQVFVDHPATVIEFERTKQAVYESKGWTPDSPAALAYERRLMQAEASGWFGLSNIYASFMGAIVAGLLVACASVMVAQRRLTLATGIAMGVAACALAGLLLSKSKGGVGAMGLSLALCAGFAAVRRWKPGMGSRLGGFVGPAAIVLVLGAVGVRGLIGTDLGEKSLLFRAFYAVGSLRIWGDHPIFGVGPDGFQDAYAAAKIPIATETVQSPHSVVFDWTSTLGLFGLAWVVWLVWRSTRLFDAPLDGSRDDAVSEPGQAASRDMIRAIVLVVAAAGLGSAFVERELATPAYAAARVLGLAGWIAAAIGMLALVRTSAGGWLAAAAGLALVAHAQIEVTPVWVNAAPLFGVWFGVVTAGRTATFKTDTDPASEGSRRGVLARSGFVAKPLLPIALAVWVAVSVWVPVGRWESLLKSAAMIVRPGADLRMMLDEAVVTRDRAGLERVAAEVSALTGRAVAARADMLDRAVESIRLRSLEAAAEPLEQAMGVRPGHVSTQIERDRACLVLAASARDEEAKRRYLDAAHWLWSDSSVVRPRSVGLWDWRGVRSERLAAITAEIEGTERFVEWRLDEALDAWRAVEARSPHAVRPAVRLMDLYSRRGEREEAAVWAAEAIRRDELTGLDPIAGLTEAERGRAAAVLAE